MPTDLFNLPLEGTGADIESASSFVIRLAEAHSIQLHVLMREVNFRRVRSYRQASWDGLVLDSTGEISWSFVDCLSRMTGTDMERATMWRWRAAISPRRMMHRARPWCPECLSEDARSARPPWLRLAWALSPSTVCSAHETTLVFRCSSCGEHQVPRPWRGRPGRCGKCWKELRLGRRPRPVRASAAELETARQLCQLLTVATPKSGQLGLSRSLGQLVESCGGCGRFARAVGASKTAVEPWLTGRVTPTLPQLVKIAGAFSVPLAQLLIGGLGGATLQLHLPLGGEAAPTHKRTRPDPTSVSAAVIALGWRGREVDWPEIEGASGFSRKTVARHAGVEARADPLPFRDLARAESR
jgi:transcriptional regulator with XRE-family HTH domain